MLYSRPFSQTKANLIEIINEFYFIFLYSWLMHFDSESKWSSSITGIFVWIMSFNSIITLVILLSNIFPFNSIVDLWKQIITKWKARKKDNIVTPVNIRNEQTTNIPSPFERASRFVMIYSNFIENKEVLRRRDKEQWCKSLEYENGDILT